MNKSIGPLMFLTAAIGGTGGTGGALADMKAEDAIQTRQAGYKFMAWNMGKIKEQVVDGSVVYNKD